MFDFTPKQWTLYLECLNREDPVDKVPFKLSDEEKKRYDIALKDLIADRKKYPDVPINYPTTVELDW